MVFASNGLPDFDDWIKWATDFLTIVFRYKCFLGFFHDDAPSLECRAVFAAGMARTEQHNSARDRSALLQHLAELRQAQSDLWLLVARERGRDLLAIRGWVHHASIFLKVTIE
eukprot:4681630-Pyramimonas_sp.AAC.1